ncbi:MULTISPECIES: hypothetical protein [Tsukamurella]|uniref:Uncharacterized protein n=2 Tax=Tsukamurella TaxID=2060 RepID=A0A5C5RY53_9ACTN|nr:MULTISPECIES: hypothetical protein [Tsukamurella]NMD56643.1 hypothetical protein [Tsukamurella columbiensis]TWS27433.1 hypothetical protein FK530_18060 [Tsukamurella conjunctivitidis]
MNRASRIATSAIASIASVVVAVSAGGEATRHGVWAWILACVCVFIVGTALSRLLGQWIKAAIR